MLETLQERIALELRPPLDVCQILQEEDLVESCESLSKNFQDNIVNATQQIARNIDSEWTTVTTVNPDLSTPRLLRNRNNLQDTLLHYFEYFITKCLAKKKDVIDMLPVIREQRRAYLLSLTQFNETLREFTLNETPENRITLTRLETEKDSLRRTHNKLLIDYNQKVLDLQLELDNFKQGIIIQEGSNPSEKWTISFYKFIDELRTISAPPGETIEQRLARDAEFNSWKEQLKLPSNWLIEVETPEPDVSPFEGLNPMNIDNRTYFDLSSVPSTSAQQELVPPTSSEIEFNIPSPDFSPINIPSPSRLDEIHVLPSHPPTPREISPTFSQHSSEYSSLVSNDEFRPKSNIGDTLLHRKHIKNANLIRRIKRAYWKIRNTVEFYVKSDPFTTEYQTIQRLNTTIEELSREWKSIRVPEQDNSRQRDETRDRSRDERTSEHPRVARITIQSIGQMYNDWIESRDNLKTYAVDIENSLTRIVQLQKSLDHLYTEIEQNDESEQLLNDEEVMNRELVMLRKKLNTIRPEIMRLRDILVQKRTALSQEINKLRHNLLRKKATLEAKIARSQASRG